MNLLGWLRSSKAAALRALREEIEQERRAIDIDRREIAETKPLVEEAVRRTNETFSAVEKETSRASMEVAMIRDLNLLWNEPYHG